MRSSPVRGKSTKVSSLSVNGPLNENRLRWMRRIGGSRDKDNRFVAFCNVLQLGQFLSID